jgi:hypothetical protein
MDDILGDTSQGKPTSPKILISPAIPTTASAHVLFHINSEAVLNQTECTDKPSNPKSAGAKRSSIESIESQPFSKVPKFFSSSTVLCFPQMSLSGWV